MFRKILDLKSSFEQIFSVNGRWVPLKSVHLLKCLLNLRKAYIDLCLLNRPKRSSFRSLLLNLTLDFSAWFVTVFGKCLRLPRVHASNRVQFGVRCATIQFNSIQFYYSHFLKYLRYIYIYSKVGR